MSELSALAEEISSCRKCDLSKSRNRAVPGEGPADARILFIGEAPGWHENEQGRPFVGPAGRFLNDLLASIDLKREEVFIANVVKCRPPQNRDPLPEEVQACFGYLDRQIKAIAPRLIVTLGRHSMGRFFPAGKGIRDLHGTTCLKDGILCYAMYHPAAALHQPGLKKTLEADMLRIPKLAEVAISMAQPEAPAQPPAQDPPTQLSLF